MMLGDMEPDSDEDVYDIAQSMIESKKYLKVKIIAVNAETGSEVTVERVGEFHLRKWLELFDNGVVSSDCALSIVKSAKRIVDDSSLFYQKWKEEPKRLGRVSLERFHNRMERPSREMDLILIRFEELGFEQGHITHLQSVIAEFRALMTDIKRTLEEREDGN